jgi:hypothetical protein
MSIDLEARLQEQLRARAAQVEPLRLGGESLRRTAAARRARRTRTATVAGVIAAVAVIVVGISVTNQGGRHAEAPSAPTPSPTRTDGLSRLIRVPVSEAALGRARTLTGDGAPQLYASAVLPRSGDTVLVLRTTRDSDDKRHVVYTITLHGGNFVVGTLAYYRAADDLVAQPVRDGAGTTLVVVTPPGTDADTAEVTTSLPGRDIEQHTAQVESGLALIPVPAADAVTRLRLSRNGETLRDTIPGDFHLGAEMPASAARVIVAAGPTNQPVQVRTDGRTACRLTVAGLAGPGVFAMEWNPFDEACHAIDGKLHLLLAADRRYSSVTGIAPAKAELVRLHWRNGDVTEVAVARDEVPAFVDTSSHRPDRLELAEALDRNGVVIASTSP